MCSLDLAADSLFFYHPPLSLLRDLIQLLQNEMRSISSSAFNDLDAVSEPYDEAFKGVMKLHRGKVVKGEEGAVAEPLSEEALTGVVHRRCR